MSELALERPRRVLIVTNPISGRGKGPRAAAELAEAFARHGVAAQVLETQARGDAARLLRSAGHADLVVAAGGDGTLSDVLLGLSDRATPIGILPCGTANVLAKTLGLPRSIEPAVASFLGGRLQPLDVARVGERYSHLVVGIGFDALTVQEVEKKRKGPITKTVYVGAALRALARYRPVPLRVWIDGRELPGTSGMVWVANTPKYADLLRFARGTRLDDGVWEAYLFPTGSRPELVSALLRGIVASLPGGPITLQRARSVRIEAPEPVPYQVDGDLGGTTPVEIALLPERFRLVVP